VYLPVDEILRQRLPQMHQPYDEREREDGTAGKRTGETRHAMKHRASRLLE
jgi:hypothetical protein